MNVRALIPILGLGLATGCAPLASADAPQPRPRTGEPVAGRVQFGVAAGGGQGARLDAVGDSLADGGYTDQTRVGETTAMVRVWARTPVAGRVSGKLTYDYRFGTDLDTEDPASTNLRIAEFHTKEYTVSLTGEIPVGPVWIEAGPALKILSIEYDEELTVGNSVFGEEWAETLTQLGAVVRTSFRYPVIPEMSLLASAGYSYFPDPEGQETVAAPIGVGGWSVLVGLEWAPLRRP